MEEKGSKHSERDKQPSYCQITKLAVYRTEPPTRFGGVVCVGPSSAVAGRSPATESDVCPPQRCDSHPNRTPGICARLPIARHRAHTAPAMPLTSAMAASFVVYPPPSHILRQDILRARKRDPPPHGSGRIGGLGLPGRASLAPGATCPKIQLPCLVTGSGRASPGLSLVTQNKQSLLTGREVRDAQRRRPLCLASSPV